MFLQHFKDSVQLAMHVAELKVAVITQERNVLTYCKEQPFICGFLQMVRFLEI